MPSSVNSVTWKTFNYFRIGEGSHTGSGLYNFGEGNPAVKSKNSTYRSLGSLTDASNRSIMYGVLIENNTGAPITSLDVNYTGKVWRIGSAATAVDTLAFSYVVLTMPATIRQLRDRTKFLGDIRARNVPALDFYTPSTLTAATSGTVASPVTGEDPANQTHLTATIPVTIQPGQVVMLRWTDTDEDGADQALSIDDIVIKATVENVTGLEDIITPSAKETYKYLYEGKIIIIRNNKKYDLFGRLIRG